MTENEIFDAMLDNAWDEHEELLAYRAIGTAEECRKSVEKQKTKKPITYEHTCRVDCPICGATVRGIDKPFGGWCSKCGQKLNWRGADE